MKVLVLGGNSYIAKSFIKTYQEKYSLKSIKRDDKLTDYFQLKKEDFSDFEVVINFTAIVHNKKATENLHNKYNFELVKYLAERAKEADVKHFIHFSTIAVYGDTDFIDDATRPTPNTPYGKFKLCADEYLEILGKDMLTSILRPTVVYGEGAPGNMKMLIKLIKTNLPLPFAYDENKRSILCVHNLTFALSVIIDKKVGGVFLLRDKEVPSISELSNYIKKVSKSKSIFFSFPKMVYISVIKYKISAAKKLFGNLKIDDSKTIEKIGEYRKYTWENCIIKMIQ